MAHNNFDKNLIQRETLEFCFEFQMFLSYTGLLTKSLYVDQAKGNGTFLNFYLKLFSDSTKDESLMLLYLDKALNIG